MVAYRLSLIPCGSGRIRHELRVPVASKDSRFLTCLSNSHPPRRCSPELAPTKRSNVSTSSPPCAAAFSTFAPPQRAKLTRKLHDWHLLDFAAFRAEVKRAFHQDIPVRERDEWESHFWRENAQRVQALTTRIADAEWEIDQIVYALFGLQLLEEVALLESSLQGQY